MFAWVDLGKNIQRSSGSFKFAQVNSGAIVVVERITLARIMVVGFIRVRVVNSGGHRDHLGSRGFICALHNVVGFI